MSHEQLGTKYCPNCAILNEKMIQLKIWELELKKREEELEKELEFINKNK
jgi:hypothetical protein